MKKLPTIIAASSAVIVGSIIAAVIIIHAGVFTASFTGAPPAPLPYSVGTFMDGFDVQVHNNSMTGADSLPSIQAQHGADCSSPPAAHTATLPTEMVFQCANHVMTAMNGAGYGAIYLTPNQLLDFATGGTVSFDLSTLHMSTRDWWDITVSPFADSQALPLLSDLSGSNFTGGGVDLQEPNRNSVVVTTDNGQLAPNLKVVINNALTAYGGSGVGVDADIPATVNQAAVRQHFVLTLSATHVKFERLVNTGVPSRIFIDQDIPALGWTQGVVNFGHHSYNPTKDGSGQPATWHWDEFAIDPAVPFYIGKTSPRWVGSASTITATALVPTGAYLRFSAICRPTINGVVQTKQSSSGHPEHYASYLVPIVAGSTSWAIDFLPDDWYNSSFGCSAKDFSVFALNGAPTPTATATATPTQTVTPTPTITPTPDPRTYRCQIKNTTNNTYTNVWTKVGGGSCP